MSAQPMTGRHFKIAKARVAEAMLWRSRNVHSTSEHAFDVDLLAEALEWIEEALPQLRLWIRSQRNLVTRRPDLIADAERAEILAHMDFLETLIAGFPEQP